MTGPSQTRSSQLTSAREALAVAERRLARLRFDLHDGPQQDLHILADDLRLFRDQLRSLLADHPDRERVLGRVDDLEAQLLAADAQLRRLTTSTSPSLPDVSGLPDGLHQLAAAFASRTGVLPDLAVRGALPELTDSQRIALLSVVREALSNIRRHSDAETVEIVVAAREEAVEVEVRDDGGGFDPQAALERAGRLGLVGMHERMRMLGGTTTIDSRPGGPTRVLATLPRWPAPG